MAQRELPFLSSQFTRREVKFEDAYYHIIANCNHVVTQNFHVDAGVVVRIN